MTKWVTLTELDGKPYSQIEDLPHIETGRKPDRWGRDRSTGTCVNCGRWILANAWSQPCRGVASIRLRPDDHPPQPKDGPTRAARAVTREPK